MNEQGVEVLVKAAMEGKRQARRTMHAYAGGSCAMGYLHIDAHNGNEHAAIMCSEMRMGVHFAQWPCQWVQRFGLEAESDRQAICDANDEDGWDLLTIARKLGPDSA